MPRFVILQHELPPIDDSPEAPVHWDFMLERPEALVTWSLPEAPDPEGEIVVVTEVNRIQDHRKKYLEYEGPVSGGRGVVTLWDAGDYDLLSVVESVRPRRWEAELSGRILVGRLSLVEDLSTSREKSQKNKTVSWTFSLKMKK